MQHGVCLAREVDLVPGWNPAILDARELKAYSTSELLVRLSWAVAAPSCAAWVRDVYVSDGSWLLCIYAFIWHEPQHKLYCMVVLQSTGPCCLLSQQTQGSIGDTLPAIGTQRLHIC